MQNFAKTLLTQVKNFGLVTLIAFGLIASWPGFIKHAGATEVTIDNSISTGTASNFNSNPTVVFVSDQVGYAFFVDSGGACVYSKTTDAGVNWGSAQTFDSQTDCLKPAVWYDRWTPGDTTGNYIHIVSQDSGADDLWYNRLDTTSDTLQLGTSPVATTGAAGANKTNTFGTSANPQTMPAITKGTDGDIYIGVEDTGTGGDESYVLKCAGSCDTASNWTTTEASWTTTEVGLQNTLIILPLSGGNIMAIHHDDAASDIAYMTFTDSTGLWDHDTDAWTDINDTVNNGTRTTISAVVDTKTNNIYLSVIDQNNGVSGGGNDDLEVYKFNGSSWSALTALITNDASRGLVSSRLVLNHNNGDIYVIYTVESTPGTNTTRDIYYKKSTNDGSSWGSESTALQSGQDNYTLLGATPTSRDRLYLTWRDGTDDDLRGETVADLVPPTYDPSGYRWFRNVDSTDVGAAIASQDTASIIPTNTVVFRLRLLLHVSGDGARTTLDNLKLQYAVKSGTCDTGYSGETYADVTTTTDIAYFGNPTPSDDSNLTSNGNDPTHSSDTIRNQTYNEANNFTNSNLAIATGEDGKWDFALYDRSAPDNTNYCFRVMFSDGTATVTTPSLVPEISTPACTSPSSTTDQMRHSAFFCAESSRGIN